MTAIAKERDMHSWNSGSTWLRWDPHIHTPGTRINDQYNIDINEFAARISKRNTDTELPVRAIGVTDYFTIDTYKTLRRIWRQGGLTNVDYLFPNVEIRLDVKTEKGSGVNAHLLFASEDEDHETTIEDHLRVLEFRIGDDVYHLTSADLIRLGKRANKNLPDPAALLGGAHQFKVDVEQLKQLLRRPWMQRNCLFAPSLKADSLSGIGDDSFSGARENIEMAAHLFFSSNDGDHKYWTCRGKTDAHKNDARRKGGPKPCIHGSDAHREDALEPAAGRACWIRARPNFAGLRQTIHEPEARVHIGPRPPAGPSASRHLAQFRVGAPWFRPQDVHLNDGLVAVIGPRGSGKTAFVELLALAGGGRMPDEDEDRRSFVIRARSELKGVTARVTWGDGSQAEIDAGGLKTTATPRVRYLSQHFVEQATDRVGAGALLRTIYDVAFESLPEAERSGAGSFDELKTKRLSAIAGARADVVRRIRDLTSEITAKRNLDAELASRQSALQESEESLRAVEKEITDLNVDGTPSGIQELQALSDQKRDFEDRSARLQRRALAASQLAEEAERLLRNANGTVAGWRTRYADIEFSDADWAAFRVAFAQDGTAIARERAAMAADEMASIEANSLAPIRARIAELGTTVVVQEDRKRRIADALERRVKLQRARDGHAAAVEASTRAAGELQSLRTARRSAFEELGNALDRETEVMRTLIQPLEERAAAEASTFELKFEAVVRVDGDSTQQQVAEQFDRRRARSELAEDLVPEVCRALDEKRWLEAAAMFEKTEDVLWRTRERLKRSFAEVATIVGGMLERVQSEFRITHRGTPIDKLSPGLRGTVLLALFLILDASPAPLVIDQPEENLDPQTVFRDLVPAFRAARRRRQVILVTHNANLVVNVDADQVVVASAAYRAAGEMPSFEYTSGALEDDFIREAVCKILEGGREAFQRRERRYELAMHPQPDDA